MSVADLTGTTWTFDNVITSETSLSQKYITFVTADTHSSTWGRILYQASNTALSYRELIGDWTPAYRNTGWAQSGYETITISGGTDVTDADLIAWLEANATQVTPSGNVLVSYKGETIAAFSGTTKTLTTAGKYLEADILVTDNAGTVTLQDKTTTPTQSTQTITADSGYTGLGTVTVNPIPQNYGLITYNGSTITVS